MKIFSERIVAYRALLSGVALSGAFQLAGCASDAGKSADPFEGVNRSIFSFNVQVDAAITRHVANFYVEAVPEFAEAGIHNVLGNVSAPITFSNAVLQGETGIAGNTLARFVINSSIGLGGLVDVAAQRGLLRDKEDFGITLGVWGAEDGPYLVLPFGGPSNARDLAGAVGDYFMDPLTYMKWNNSTLYSSIRVGLTAVDLRARNMEEFDQVERSSIDGYAMAKSLYEQFRANKIRHGKPEGDDLPDF